LILHAFNACEVEDLGDRKQADAARAAAAEGGHVAAYRVSAETAEGTLVDWQIDVLVMDGWIGIADPDHAIWAEPGGETVEGMVEVYLASRRAYRARHSHCKPPCRAPRGEIRQA
jgi:hypothetical protein